ncbi:MAG TPA: L-aspartate oxidase, partial [Xanthobacteraceae bacterium]|nr:L-aspartate oxidase [Xanthobacteraceae bacterium]
EVRDLRRLMSADVGVVREADGLGRALAAIARGERAASTPALRNMMTAALMIAAAARRRRESRGGHFRSDYPNSDAAQAQRNFLTLADARALADEAAHARTAVAAL